MLYGEDVQLVSVGNPRSRHTASPIRRFTLGMRGACWPKRVAMHDEVAVPHCSGAASRRLEHIADGANYAGLRW
jgi:hypothetical protein